MSLYVQFILLLWTSDSDLKGCWPNSSPKETSKRKLTKRSKERRKGALKDKQSEQKQYYGPSNLTEYLFADKYGEISDTINTSEIN